MITRGLARIAGLPIIAALLLIPALLVAQGDQTVISGTVSSQSGDAPASAHVHLYPMAHGLGAGVLASTEVDSTGSYTIAIDEPGFYRLIFTGVNHDYVEVPVIVDEADRQISLDVALGRFRYVTDPESLLVIGDFNDFSFRDAQPMMRQDDGTWIYSYETDKTTMTYQVIGLTASPADGRSVNVPGSSSYSYDGGGDYRSVERVRPGMVTIVVDPARLPSEESNMGKSRFKDHERDMMRQLDYVWQTAWKDFGAAVMAYREAEAAGTTITEHPAEVFRGLIMEGGVLLADEELPMRARQMAALNVLRAASNFGPNSDIDPALLEQARALLPSDSDFWAAAPYQAISASIGHLDITNGDVDEITERLIGLYETSPVYEVRAQALSQLVMGADYLGQDDIVEQYYPVLLRDYRDAEGVDRLLQRLDPGRAIKVGKMVPDFEVALEDGSGRVLTRESMLGQYYLIDFWATWCGPCVREMPEIHEAYTEFSSDNFEILSLSFDSDFGKVASFRERRYAMPWLHGFVEGGFESDLSQSFEVTGIPKPILVNPEGTIVAVDGALRGERLAKTLGTHLQIGG